MKFKRLLISGAITFLLGLCMNNIMMPIWDFDSRGTWLFLLFVLVIWAGISALFDFFIDENYTNTAILTIAVLICITALTIPVIKSVASFFRGLL